jgi:hypothetical protein
MEEIKTTSYSIALNTFFVQYKVVDIREAAFSPARVLK